MHSCFCYLHHTIDLHSYLMNLCSIIIAVGYMFRYSAMAQAAKKILKEHDAAPLAVIARYACAYSDIRKKDWYAHTISNTAKLHNML